MKLPGGGVVLSLGLALLMAIPAMTVGSPTPSANPPAAGLPAGPLPTTLQGWVQEMGLQRAGPLPYAGPSPSLPRGTDLYVSNTGSDTAACTMAAPCRQISEALAVVAPGDTILVSNGTFLGFDVNTIVGTKAAPIVIESPGRDSRLIPTVNRSDNRDTVHVEFSDNITLDGFQSYRANRAAVRIDTSDNVTISNCTFGDNAEWGIFTDFDHNSTIEHNSVFGSVGQHGIYVSNSPIAPVVRWNVLYNNTDAGLQINADATQGGWGVQSGGDIEDNVIYNNGASGAAGINLDGNWNTRVVNNLLYDNHATGIVNYMSDGAAGPRGMTIMDNTVVMASNGRWALQFEESTGENFVRDNILDNLNPAHGGIEFGTMDDVNDTDSDYNVLGSVTIDSSGAVDTLAQWQALGYEPHSISATPAQLFVDYTAGNYQLSATSPAIRAGEYLPNVTTDLLGNPRPVGTPSDIGAYQYVSSALAAGASATPLSGTAPLTVDFTGGATGGTSPYTFLWTYGDGAPSSPAMDPVHIYNATGTYPVELTVTDSAASVAHAFLNVTATTFPALTAVASGSPLTGTAPLTVSFTSSISGGSGTDSEFWTFGDGSRASHAGDPSHTYNATGSYAVALRVNDTVGQSAFANLTVSVTAAPPPALSATASSSVSSGTAPLAVDFDGSASGGAPPYTFRWSFGDGSAVVAAQDPSHTFSSVGTFQVTLWATDSASGNVTDTLTITTSAVGSPPPLTADLKGPTAATVGTAVDFWAVASGGEGSYDYSWYFGTGDRWTTPSSSNSTSVVFAAVGEYQVWVWVNDTSGGSVQAGPRGVTVTSSSNHESNNTCSGCVSPPPLIILPLLALVAAVAVAAFLVVFLVRRRRSQPPPSPPGSPDPDTPSSVPPPP